MQAIAWIIGWWILISGAALCAWVFTHWIVNAVDRWRRRR